MKTLIALVATLSLSGCWLGESTTITVTVPKRLVSPPPDIIVPLPAQQPPDAFVVLVMGQSNAVGRAEVQRLANTTGNPLGYVPNPPNVRIYAKGNFQSPDLTVDNGQWQPYYAGLNSNTDGSPFDHFGPELSMSQQITRRTGKPVYIIKAAFGGTALSPGIPTYAPGNWTDTITAAAMNNFLAPAMRDLAIAQPNARIRILGVIWWQGETDAAANVPGWEYQSRFGTLKSTVNARLAAYAQPDPIRWFIPGLSFSRTPAEAAISASQCAAANASTDSQFFSTLAYPNKLQLTAAQSAPTGTMPYDDIHSSYLAQIAVGEAAANWLLGGQKVTCTP